MRGRPTRRERERERDFGVINSIKNFLVKHSLVKKFYWLGMGLRVGVE